MGKKPKRAAKNESLTAEIVALREAGRTISKASTAATANSKDNMRSLDNSAISTPFSSTKNPSYLIPKQNKSQIITSTNIKSKFYPKFD